jgi:hypothetical protein
MFIPDMERSSCERTIVSNYFLTPCAAPAALLISLASSSKNLDEVVVMADPF